MQVRASVDSVVVEIGDVSITPEAQMSLNTVHSVTYTHPHAKRVNFAFIVSEPEAHTFFFLVFPRKSSGFITNRTSRPLSQSMFRRGSIPDRFTAGSSKRSRAVSPSRGQGGW